MRKDVLRLDFLEELTGLGANVKEGIDRVMGDNDLYVMMLGMFVDTLEKDPVTVGDFDQEDLEAVTKRVHTLKGITGNLSLTPLFNSYMEVLTLLRASQPAKAQTVFTEMLPLQEKFVDCIRRHRG